MGNLYVHLGFHLLAPLWPVTLLFLLFGCPSTSQRIRDCQWPQVPQHGGFQCVSLCSTLTGGKAFSGAIVEYYCEGGYAFSGQSRISICRKGKWTVNGNVLCQVISGPTVDSATHTAQVMSSFPVIAVVAITVSSLLLMAMVCVLLKPKSRCRPDGSNYRRMEEPDIIVVNGQPVLLPSYEEAVYGPQGNENPPPSSEALTWEEGQISADLANQTTGMPTPPPAYEEVPTSTWLPPSGTEQNEMRVPPLRFLFNVPTTK